MYNRIRKVFKRYGRKRVVLVVVATDQILNCDHICPGCLLADRQGRPRWQGDRPGCAVSMADPQQGRIFECQMGFRLVNVDWEAGSLPP